MSDSDKVKRLIEVLNDIADMSEGKFSYAYEVATRAITQYGTPIDSQRGMFHTWEQ